MALNDGYQRHSMQRGFDRYGLELSITEYKALSVRLGFHELTGEPECVRLCHAGVGKRQKWAVWFKGEWMPLVFDPEQARIVTLLPANELRRFRHVLPW